MSKARLISRFNISSANIADGTIVSGDIADNAITDVKLSTNLAANISGAVPKISTVTYPADDLAVSNVGGQTVIITGTGFKNGATVYIGTTVAPTVTFTNSTSLSFTTPALTAGDYLLYVINPDGSTGIGIPGLSVSGVPAWVTPAGALANTTESAYSTTVNATSDSNVTYTILSGALPSGLSLNANTGTISGTLTSDVANLSSNTTYNITLDAKDLQNQNTTRAFSITYIPTYPTWNSPNAGALTSGEVGLSYTANLNATSNSGITYSIPSGNLIANITISGSTLTGTPPSANTYYFTIRATDAEGHFTDRNFNVNFAVTADSNFRDTVLLLNGDGNNSANNHSFIDSSSNGFSVVRANKATQGTFSPFSNSDGYWSALAVPNGTNSIDTGYAGLSGTGDYTVSFWIYLNSWTGGDSNGGDGGFIYIYDQGSSHPTYSFAINITKAGKVTINDSANFGASWYSTFNSAGSYNTSYSIGLNAWNYIHIVRSSGTLSIYANGNLQFSTTQSSSTPAPYTNGKINPGNGFDGYISNFRIVTSAITDATSPTAPSSTSTTNQVFLGCASNRFIDRNTATSAKTVTKSGTTSIQPFSPFAPTAAYSATTNGGSGAFLNANDAVNTPSASATNSTFDLAGTQDWQIDFWYYPLIVPDTFYGPFGATNPNGNGIFFAQRSGFLDFVNGNDNAGLIRSNYPPLNAWAHIVLVNNGSTNTRAVFINGVRSGTQTNTYTFTNGGFNISAGSSSTGGYISNFRVLKNERTFDPASSTLTVPSSPTTSTGSNTIVLLNFTNAGIIDQTGKNALETVGDAKIDTGTKKFGTGSISFDGTGDYLYSSSRPHYSLSGDFTIEYWFYRVGTNNFMFTLGDSNTSTGIETYIGNSGTLFYLYSGAARISSGTTPTVNAWNHIAAVRSGSTITLYLNGSSVGTWSSTTTFSGNVYVGAEFYGGAITGTANGYFDDVRITRGNARYTSNFTPSTAAFSLR